ncbi:MAG: hypothetical protein GQ569_14160 [Methylococcaceae bacterium]|nr:hypothetical protein [Methylococcaceae bacterium]
MDLQKELEILVNNLKTERDEIKLKLHLASMDIKDEFENVEKKWDEVSQKAVDIADDSKETSEEFIGKVKIVGEELKGTYERISSRLSDK